MNEKPNLVDTWTSVQRAETLLFRAAAHQNLPQFRNLFDGFDIDGDARGLLIRMGCGFNPQHLAPEDYLIRYPFSSVEAIRAGLDRVVESDHALKKGDGNYALNERGENAIRTWMQRVSVLMQAVDLGDIPQIDVQKLLAYDRRILDAMQTASRPHGNPIFTHRLRGLHPSYDPPQLWHHWQLVWTMLATSEDEQEYVRQQRGLSPLVWFVRRQTWFVHRRPWLVRAKLTLENLARRATGYSPMDRAEEACAQAVAELETRNWLKTVDEEFRLTKTGLAACDKDEGEVDTNFLSCWPAFSADELKELLDITTRLNDRFSELSHQD